MKYYCIPTNIGMAAASNAFLTGTKVNITTFVVGDGAGAEYEPAPDMTALRGQVWQGTVTNAEIDPVSPNIIYYTALLPSNVGGFTMREMGLKDDAGRLIGVGNMASTPKIKFEDGISDETELIFSLTISTPEAMEWKVDPTVIIATKKDIDRHNTNDSSHADLRAELSNKAKGNPATGDALNAEKVLGTDKIMTLDGTGYVNIPAGADLNDVRYRNFGVYFSGSNDNTATLKNAPFPMAFVMWVLPGAGTPGYYPSQFARRYTDGATVQRTWDDYEQTWGYNWLKNAQTETTRLTLINGWVAYSDAFVPWASRSGNVVTINAFIKNPSQIDEFTMIPFMLPYKRVKSAANTYPIDNSSKAIYRFEIGSVSIAPGETIPANSELSFCFSYSCE